MTHYLAPRCRVAFCDRVMSHAQGTCTKHVGFTLVDWLVIGDPETGSDAYLYDGLEYTIGWWLASGQRGKFDGTCNTEHSPDGHVWFDLPDGGYIVLPDRSIKSVSA